MEDHSIPYTATVFLTGTIGLGVPSCEIVMSTSEFARSKPLIFFNAEGLRSHGSVPPVGIKRYRYDFAFRHMDRAIARRYVTGIIFYRVGKSIISRCRNIKLAGNRDIAGHVAIMIVNGAYAIHRTE